MVSKFKKGFSLVELLVVIAIIGILAAVGITAYQGYTQSAKEKAVLANRKLMGATNPKDAEEGTIRKKFGISIDKNSVHGSDSVDNAKIEINFFFKN